WCCPRRRASPGSYDCPREDPQAAGMLTARPANLLQKPSTAAPRELFRPHLPPAVDSLAIHQPLGPRSRSPQLSTRASSGPQDICHTFRADCELITTLLRHLSPSRRRQAKRVLPGRGKEIGGLPTTQPPPSVSLTRDGSHPGPYRSGRVRSQDRWPRGSDSVPPERGGPGWPVGGGRRTPRDPSPEPLR